MTQSTLITARDRHDITRAREILADATHHPDHLIKSACDTLLDLSKNPDDIKHAGEWLITLASDP